MTVDNVHTFKDDTLDDSLYSRQRYVLGDFAMNQLQKAHIFLSGLGGLGVEIAKNVVLAGPNAITLHDTKAATKVDLSSQFYINEGDVGKNRAALSALKIAELNPYVTVQAKTDGLDLENLSYFDQFKCVILTDTPLSQQITINAYCHKKRIAFLSADTFGAFAWAFADFGPEFIVHDKDGEEVEEILVGNVTKEERGVVTVLDNRLHGLQDGDSVQFREVLGMTELNNNTYQVSIKTPKEFYIGDTSKFSAYVSGGIIRNVKTKQTMNFLPLSESLQKPEILLSDLAKFSTPAQLHIGNMALHAFVEKHKKLPRAWNSEDAKEFTDIATDINSKSGEGCKVDDLDLKFLEKLANVAEGAFSPISAFMGGFIGQEVLKSVTGKFTPLKQWLYFDAVEVLPEKYTPADDSLSSTRSAGQAIVLGLDTCRKLENFKVFTVGSGAIGCEMMKNYALMGVSSGKGKGLITLTDNDLIEKSNLNRQFLFRNTDIQKPKSECAARAAKAMNPALNVETRLDKVGSQTESIYSDAFFGQQDVVVNALDNVAARMYVDSRIVANERPLLESGTLGTKGHVQVILPHKTESYTSQRDPPEKDVPFCTLKSFPNTIDHCTQWARDKFEMLFSNKPSEKFFEDPDFLTSVKNSIKPVRHIMRLLDSRPTTFEQCINFARRKFETYFRNNILQLVRTYPEDLQGTDGKAFWASPRRFPTALEFKVEDPTHLDFVLHTACLWATIFKVPIPEPLDRAWVTQVAHKVEVPRFVFKEGKKIETDVNAKAPQTEEFDETELHGMVAELMNRRKKAANTTHLVPEKFEKDDDSNHHIAFIAATANLRARNYAIEEADKLKIKRIAGKIIPAIATTTSVVSGLVALELAKLACDESRPIERFRNAFLNLALPVFALSEPATAPRIPITKTAFYTLWDKWEVKGGDLTLQQFMDWFFDKWKLKVSGVFQGTSIVYAPFFPAHAKKLPQKLQSLVKFEPGATYVDLVTTFEDEDGKEVNGPDVRYHFQK